MSSAICLNLDQSNILSSGYGLNIVLPALYCRNISKSSELEVCSYRATFYDTSEIGWSLYISIDTVEEGIFPALLYVVAFDLLVGTDSE